METKPTLDMQTMRDKAGRASHLLKLMANPNRLMILCYLVEGEKCVGELEAKLDLSQSALSQHLAKLRCDGLVATRRESLQIYYSIADDRVLSLLNTLYDLYCADQ